MKKNRLSINAKRLLSIAFFVFVVVNVFSQVTVKGILKDEKGEPLIGVVVSIKGTLTAVPTGIDGDYSIKVKGESDTLVFRYVGYQTKEVRVGNQTVIDFSMELEAKKMEEVVIIGYGGQKKSDLTGSVVVVSSEELNKAAPASFDQALEGQAPGVLVTQNSGRPGADMSVKIRGIGSINASSDPLYVIDGVPISNNNLSGTDGSGATNINPLSTINPSDIESMEVLKDASSCAIYGARGANGVILINTKRGVSGKPQVTFSSYIGINYKVNSFKLLNANQYCTLQDSMYSKAGLAEPLAYSDSARRVNGYQNTNWQKALAQPGIIQNYNLGVSSGSEFAKFSLSANYYKANGTLVGTDMERYSVRINSDLTISKWLKAGESLILSRVNSENETDINGNPWGNAYYASPLMPIKDPNNAGGYAGPSPSVTGQNDETNPVGEQMAPSFTSNVNRVFADVYAEAEIIKGLKYKADMALDYSNGINNSWTPEIDMGKYVNGIFTQNGNRSSAASLNEGYNDSREWLFNNTITYVKDIGAHNITLMAGASEESVLTSNFSVTGNTFLYPGFPYMSNATVFPAASGGVVPYTFQSEFGRLLYNYNSKYLITASIRRDGSSRFGPNNKYGTFPSFSLGWKLNEDFLKNVKRIDMLKLRFGWGQTGNDNLGNFKYTSLIDNGPATSRYAFGSPSTEYYGATEFSNQGNPNLVWEAATMTNAGIDVNLFKNQLFFTGEYYVKNQSNMLVQEQIPLASGLWYGSPPWENLGKVMNRGFDFNVSYRKAEEREGGFSYSITGMFTTMKNKVISLANGNLPYYTNGDANITMVGHTIGSMYGYVCEGIYQQKDFDANNNIIDHAAQANAKPGDLKFKDLTGSGNITALDETIIGKPLPDFNYGATLNCGFAHFDLSVFMQGVQGIQVYDAEMANLCIAGAGNNDYNKSTNVLNYWSPTNTNTMIPRLDKDETANNSRISTRWMENGSYMRIKNVQLGYSLPKGALNAIKVARIRLYISISNLYTITRYKGLDPESGGSNSSVLSAGYDNGQTPIPRTYMMGVQVTF